MVYTADIVRVRRFGFERELESRGTRTFDDVIQTFDDVIQNLGPGIKIMTS